jgi:hypothetical protein
MLGFKALNNDGKVLISAETAALVFVGKATFISATYFKDSPAIGYIVYGMTLSNGTCYTASMTSSPYQTKDFVPRTTGYLQFYVGDVAGYPNDVRCGYRMYDVEYPDSSAIAEYYIMAETKPSIFVCGGEAYSGAIASITDSGISVNGLKRWNVRVYCAYAEGQRQLLSQLQLYCFARCRNVTPAGHGMAVYDSNGVLKYSTEFKPLVLRDVMTITGISGVGSAITSLNVQRTIETNNVFTDAKPAFLSVDWLRIDQASTVGELQYPAARWGAGCSLSVNGQAVGYMIEHVIGLGFSTLPNHTILFQISALRVPTLSYTSSKIAPYTLNAVTAQFPMSVPIIDASIYD